MRPDFNWNRTAVGGRLPLSSINPQPDDDDESGEPAKLQMEFAKNSPECLSSHRPDGIFISQFEQGDIGPDLFKKLVSLVWKDWFQNAVIVPTGRPVEALDQNQEPVEPRIRSRQRAVRVVRGDEGTLGSRDKVDSPRRTETIRRLVETGLEAGK